MAGGNVPANLAPVFRAAGQQYHVPPAVLAGIASVESNLGANASTSSAGALGLMQFLPSTARSLGVNPNDPRSAIFGAAKLLVQYGYHQNPTRAIGAYNGGPGNPQYGYARQVLSEAQRLGHQLGGGGAMPGGTTGGGAPSLTGGGSTNFQVPVFRQSFDQAGFNQANQRFIAGSAVKASDSASNPFADVPGASKGFAKALGPDSGALFAKGLLTTIAPNPADFVKAQNNLQTIAIPNVLSAHPAVQQASGGRVSNVAAGFLQPGAKYIKGRQDQGRDGQTNPGGPIVANGNGVVVNVLSDPNGFGPRYPVVHFTSGRFAGRTLYFGHTLAAVRPGQRVSAGQVLSHTGSGPGGIGNASVPGWFEIGFADGGSPGRMGQPAPF